MSAAPAAPADAAPAPAAPADAAPADAAPAPAAPADAAPADAAPAAAAPADAAPAPADAATTQRAVAEHDRLCNGFMARLLASAVERPDAWRAGVASSVARLREIRDLVESHGDGADRAIGEWLRTGEIELEIDERADASTVLGHAVERVAQIEAALVATIKTYLPKDAHGEFDKLLRGAKGVFDL